MCNFGDEHLSAEIRTRIQQFATTLNTAQTIQTDNCDDFPLLQADIGLVPCSRTQRHRHKNQLVACSLPPPHLTSSQATRLPIFKLVNNHELFTEQ